MNTTILKSIRSLVKNTCDLTIKTISSNIFLRLTFVWFTLQAFYMALTIRVGLPPDELYHINFIKLFAENGWTPWLADQEGYYMLGEAVRTPFFLYHYLMSLPYHFFQGLEYVDHILRIFNVLIGIGSLWLVYKIANVIKVSALVRNLSLFMLANTMMFVLINASVSYDSLFIFLSLSSVLLLFLIIQKTTLTRFLLLSITLACGMLVKINFLPIAFIVVAILLFKKRKGLKNFLIGSFKSSNKKLEIVLILVLVIVSLLFLHRYGLNMIQYQRYEPACDRVLTVEQCMQNKIYARKGLPTPPPSFEPNNYQYIFTWVVMMQDRSYGILAHKSADSTALIKAGGQVLLAISLFAIIRKYRGRDKELKILLLIVGFFVLVLMLKNYGSYARYGIFGIAVQGRYLFGVLPLIYILSNYYILRMLARPTAKLLYLSAMVLIFATGSLPSYIYVTGPEWHNDQAAEVNEGLKNALDTLKP